MYERPSSELADLVMEEAWGVASSKRSCTPWCGGRGLHVDDFVALLEGGPIEDEDARAEAWAKAAIASDGQGEPEVRLVRIVRGALRPFTSKEEFREVVERLRLETNNPQAEAELYRVWYFRAKH